MNTTQSRPPRFDKQWSETISMLENEHDRQALTEAIRRYQLDGTEPQLPPELALAFEFLRPTIDRRRRNRERRRAKAATAAATAPVAVTAAESVKEAEVSFSYGAPGEDDMEARVAFWQNFAATRISPLTQKEIDTNTLSFEAELWEGEGDETPPCGNDGMPLPYDSLLQHYCTAMGGDRVLLTRVSDEVVRITKMLFRTDDLRSHIDAFQYQSTVYPIAGLDRKSCRRAFIRYMINCARHYRKS